MDAWPVAGSFGCLLENDVGEGAGVDLAFGREGKNCLPPLRGNNPSSRKDGREGRRR